MKFKAALLAVIIIALIVIFIIVARPLQKILANNHLLPEPETFTELYFENHENLPSKVEAGEPYTFAFSIHSEEHRNTTYQYAIYIQTDKKKIPITNGNFDLMHNQKKTFKEKFIAPPLSNRADVIVDLLNKNQRINFWINE